MKRLLVLLLVLSLILGMVACVKTELPGEVEATPETQEEAEQTEPEVSIEDLEKADSIKINFCMGNNSRTMTYQQSDPMELPDGTIISQGDLKATWQHIQSEIGIELLDIAIQDQDSDDMIALESATGFANAVIFGGDSIAQDLMNYGAQGNFVNLKDYLDYMPDVKAYLEANENIAQAITAYDGGIYHLPYAAEIGNYARGFEGRNDWITSLLDSEDALEAETKTLEVAYEGYWDRNSTNVIDLQNEAAEGGVLTQEVALSVLKDYIADTYPDLAKPSDLYLGADAFYDMDELVALWRAVELSPNTLSKVTTGSVVEGTEISPFFLRKSKQREDLFRLMTYFDGLRVHAGDSYDQKLYVDNDGEMHFSYADENFLETVNYLEQWFSEGLIHTEFSDESIKDNFRKAMIFSDTAEGQKQFGFMTFDWFASTTAGSDKIVGLLPPVTTVSEAGITDFIHYVENARAIKPGGWSISLAASEEEINSALVLFNYFYTEEGNNVQNYSIPEGRVEGEVFTGPDGTEYPKFNQWIFDAANEYKNGDISGFLRDFMGSQLAIGYQKEIGFELQYTSQSGFDVWELYTNADVLTMSYDAEVDYLRMMPPVISLSEQEASKVQAIPVNDDQVDEIFKFITGAETALGSTDDIFELYQSVGIEEYIDIYEKGYNRMIGK